MSRIALAFQGQEMLWRVFWIYGVLGMGLLVGGAAAFAGKEKAFSFPVTALYAVYFLPFFFVLWRCSWNAESRFWGHLLRWIVFGVPFAYGAYLALYKALRLDEAARIEECRSAMTARAQAQGVDPGQFIYLRADEEKKCLQIGAAAMGWVVPDTHSAKFKADAAINFNEPCEKHMAEYARAHNVSAVDYINKNQGYLKECKASLKQERP